MKISLHFYLQHIDLKQFTQNFIFFKNNFSQHLIYIIFATQILNKKQKNKRIYDLQSTSYFRCKGAGF